MPFKHFWTWDISSNTLTNFPRNANLVPTHAWEQEGKLKNDKFQYKYKQ